jgi:hypothetical protein
MVQTKRRSSIRARGHIVELAHVRQRLWSADLNCELALQLLIGRDAETRFHVRPQFVQLQL